MLATKLRAATAGSLAWDLSYAYYTPPATLAGNISTADDIYFYSVDAQETSPQSVFFKSDGTKMYVLGDAGNDVNEYNLFEPFNLGSPSFVQSFSVATQETSPTGLFFKPDGLKMYVCGSSGDDVNEYNLSTAWNISTASYLRTFSVAAQETSPQSVFFKPDGLKMYILGSSGDDVNEYTLSTAWNISTASYLRNFSVAAQETNPTGLAFSLDGTKMYVCGSTGDDVNEYTLSTAWNISTASFVRAYAVLFTAPAGLFVDPIGGAMYVTGIYNDGVTNFPLVRQYAMGGFSVAAQQLLPYSLFFKPDGLKMYVCGSSGDVVSEYNLSTAWNTATITFVQDFSVAAQDGFPRGLFFKPDGTKMYVCGASADNVNEYTLATAWNISTASYLQSFSVAAQDTSPTGLFFKPDGLKMYVLGDAGNDVNEYNLATAWDISTASYLQNFVVGAQEQTPNGIFFKPDGTKMYILGSSGDDVNEYTLSTAWDISTASYIQNFFVGNQDSLPHGLFFKPDGRNLYMIGAATDSVYAYTIGIQP